MKVLITVDLHYCPSWFEWLIRESIRFDAVFIAGDFLDIFISEPATAQATVVQRWLRRLSETTRVAICSGNHDNAGRQVARDRAPVYQWFAELGDMQHITTDGCTQVIEDIIVTTVPYYCTLAQKSIWLDRGVSLRKSRPERIWVVLHHVPPPLRSAPMGEEIEAGAILNRCQPDYFISGHIHALPYRPGNSWRTMIGKTCVLTPGQLPGASFPNHVILDLATGRGEWVTSREIVADRFADLDHLIIKRREQ